jgi:hypothetical protein
MADDVYYNDVTGWPKDVVSTVLRKISAHTRANKVRYFKIGITVDPERRFNEEHKYNYDEMHVIYRTDSYDNVCLLERELIDHNSELTDNMIGGGGGRKGYPPYFMYVVVKHR